MYKAYLHATSGPPLTEVDLANFLKMHQYSPWLVADAKILDQISHLLVTFVLMVSRQGEAMGFLV